MDIYPLLISDQSKEIKRLHSMILKYNRLVDKLLNIDKKPSEILRSLTDEELFIFIVGKTLSFGRSLEKSITNAKSHLKDRENAIKLFTQINKE